ncbi:MAG: hypothetical protein KF831_11150 [Acidobacteria bacterium]|nr:hypothetical protein [Acidobacteriota bacterium]
MRFSLSGTLFILFASAVLFTAFAQDAPKPSYLTGEVASISDSGLELKNDKGTTKVTFGAATEFKRVPPEKPSITAATPTERSEIGQGDRLVISGFYNADKTEFAARAVYQMSKSDIARKQQQDTERWATRGISGRVASVNPATKQITIEVRGLMGSTNVVVNPKDGATFKRYAPDSVRYSEAVASSLEGVKAGDMLRAVGDRGPDGLSFAAEEILTGAFQTVAGTVKSIDAATNQITITDLQTQKDIVVQVGSGSTMKRFPEEMAQRLAGMAGGGAPGAGPGAGGQRPGGGEGTRPAGGGPGQGGPGRPGMGGGPRGGIDDMFERMPAITLGDITVGSMIAVSSTRNGQTDRVTAIKLLAGVEPFVRAAQMAAAAQGQRGGRGAVSGGFSIPGLEGFDN